MMNRHIILGAVLISAFLPSKAFSCSNMHPRNVEDIVHANIVVKAEIIEYEKVSAGERGLPEQGLIHVRTRETWKGEASEYWTFLWLNSNFGPPEKLELSRSVIIAGVWPNPAVAGGLPRVFQPPCTPAFIFPAELSDVELKRRAGVERFMDRFLSSGSGPETIEAYRAELIFRVTPEELRELLE